MYRAVLAATLLIPALARATPSTFGVTVGEVALETESSGADLLGVFGRVGLTHRLGVEAELARIDANGFDGGLHTLTVAATFDVVDAGRWIPLVLAGGGLDWGDVNTQDGHHIELGAGLEYRSDGGLVLGVDLRIGERSMTQLDELDSLPGEALTTNEGQYKSARLYAGVHF